METGTEYAFWINPTKRLPDLCLEALASWGNRLELIDHLGECPTAKSVADLCHHPAQIVDIARVEWILCHGGFYIDSDMVRVGDRSVRDLYQSIVGLLPSEPQHILIVCNEERNSLDRFISNSFFGSTSGNPLLKHLLTQLLQNLSQFRDSPINETTGPIAWSRAIFSAPDFRFSMIREADPTIYEYWKSNDSRCHQHFLVELDTATFYPELWNVPTQTILERCQTPEQYWPDHTLAAHLWLGSWKDQGTIQDSRPKLVYLTQMVGTDSRDVDFWTLCVLDLVDQTPFRAVMSGLVVYYSQESAKSRKTIKQLHRKLGKRFLALPNTLPVFNRGRGFNRMMRVAKRYFRLVDQDYCLCMDIDLVFRNNSWIRMAHHLSTKMPPIFRTMAGVIDQPDNRLRRTQSFSGGGLALRMDVFCSVAWPEHYPVYGFEDADMDVRLFERLDGQEASVDWISTDVCHHQTRDKSADDVVYFRLNQKRFHATFSPTLRKSSAVFWQNLIQHCHELLEMS